ncbi:B12-binding domain-containing radical SAM protein [Agathobacter sp.]
MSYEILLLNVSRDYSNLSSAFKDSIGQYAIASYLRQKDFKAFVYSGNVQNCKRVIESEIRKRNTYIFGFYIAADNIRIVEHVILWIKETYPKSITVVGGPQVAGLDRSFFDRTKNDYAILGEGEIPMYYLLSALIDHDVELVNVPSLIMKDSTGKGLAVNAGNNAIVCDLDSVGYPKVEDSLTGNLRQGNMVGIITGRGCPYNCAFCYEGANAKNVRFRSIDNVMEEIDYIKSNNNRLQFISIYDDTFTLKRERVLKFCEEIKKRNLLWFCEGHISFVLSYKDVLEKMIDSGLACIQFGIESGSDLVLEAYNKHTNHNMIIEAIKICKKAGIHGVTGNFIIGGAHESRKSFEESKKLAKEMIHSAKGIIELYTVYFAPYPNTRMVRKPDDFGINIHGKEQDTVLNTMRTPVVNTNDLSRNDIYNLKHEFEQYLEQEYRKAVDESTKSDILQGLVHEGKLLSINPTWEKLYREKAHINVFLEHLTDEEQNFNSKYFIIRTFEDYKIENNKMITDVGAFDGLQKDVLINAVGILSADDMAMKFYTSIEKIEKTYRILNDKCLVYMAQF